MTWNRIKTFILIITTITNGNNITKKINYKMKIMEYVIHPWMLYIYFINKCNKQQIFPIKPHIYN